tara:strand:- start:45 stop:560 length:516 start_codon:yes stop_codon:yes gene_type:complete
MGAVSLFTVDAIAETNTVSSTVVTDKAPPTANAPSIVVNNSDVCKSAFSAGVQTQILGVASGITITDENCERMKLSRSLFGMGMKVAAVSTLCQDARVFDAMLMAGTPCPYKGKIGKEAKKAWEENPEDIPSGSLLMTELKKNKSLTERKNHDYQVREETESDWENQEGQE